MQEDMQALVEADMEAQQVRHPTPTLAAQLRYIVHILLAISSHCISAPHEVYPSRFCCWQSCIMIEGLHTARITM